MSLEKAREYRQERAALIEKARGIVKEAGEEGRGDLSSEEQKRFDRLIEESDGLKDKAEAIEEREARLKAREESLYARREAAGARAFEDDPDPEKRGDLDPEKRDEVEMRAVIKSLFPERGEELTDEEAEVVRRVTVPWTEIRAANQLKGTNSQGGFLVPEGFRAELIVQQKAFGGMRRAARVITTASGNDIPWPASDDTGNTASIVGENSTSASTHVPFSSVTLEAAKYKTGPLLFSLEILQDSAIEIEPMLRARIAERMGRGTENDFANRSSTESSGPHGIQNYSTAGGASIAVGSSNLTPEKLKDLIHAIDPAYRENAAFMMHDDSWLIVNKLRVGSSDQFLLQPGLQAGEPDRLLGYPVVINNSFTANLMSSTNTTPKRPMYFGDWSHYVVRDVQGLSIFRFNERYLNSGNFGLIGFARHDGRAVFGSTVVANSPIKSLLVTTS